MRCPRILTFSFFIFTTSNIIGLQASSLPADAPPSGQPTIMLVPSNSTINPSNLAPPKPPVPPRPQPKPPAIVRVHGWAYRGCWTDDPRDRTLRGKRWKGNVTPEKCAEVCKGYTFFAVEYSDEVSIFWEGSSLLWWQDKATSPSLKSRRVFKFPELSLCLGRQSSFSSKRILEFSKIVLIRQDLI